VERRQAYKFELMPNGEQQRQMRRYAGSVRFIYNKALGLQRNVRNDWTFTHKIPTRQVAHLVEARDAVVVRDASARVAPLVVA
jgi:hypothetical protein